MFEWHRSLPPEASSVVPALPAEQALDRRFERFRRELGQGRVTLFLSGRRTEAVAFAMVRVRPEGEASFATGNGVVEVDAMAVAPRTASRGSARCCFERVHEWAAERASASCPSASWPATRRPSGSIGGSGWTAWCGCWGPCPPAAGEPDGALHFFTKSSGG